VDTDELVACVRRLGAPDATPDPTLLPALSDIDDVPALVDIGHLLAEVPAERLFGERPARPVRVAVCASFTADNVVPLLRVALLANGLAPQLYLCPFDQLGQQLSDPQSELAAFGADVTMCLLHDGAFLSKGWNPTDLDGLARSTGERLDLLSQAITGYTGRTGATVVLNTVPLSRVEHRTVLGYREKAGLGRLWRRLNSGLLELAEREPAVHVLDLEAMLVDHPVRLRNDPRYWYASMAWTPEVERVYAGEAAILCRAWAGLNDKCLVLDLDNTLWGGVVGDDGPAGIQLGSLYPGNCYSELQRRVKALRRQGVLLAVCSKNDPSTVDNTFTTHPDMELRPDDFVAWQVSWADKDAGIRRIAEELNLGLDSLVFADDSRFECDLVRTVLPPVSVVHLGGDPANHPIRLLDRGYFNTLGFTGTDGDRTRLYAERAERKRYAGSFASSSEYLHSLGIRVIVHGTDDVTLARLVQLAQRTNQFTTMGRHPGDARTRQLATTPGYEVVGFEVADRFGTEGIVCGVWVSRHDTHWLIENFVLSCRVFSRGVEHAVLQYLIDNALRAGIPRLEALFRPTERNGPAASFLAGVGFTDAEVRDEQRRLALPIGAARSVRPDWITMEVAYAGSTQ
jgi:FkbH-like protein